MGVTPTERYLNRLATQSFLQLWRYPELYRDQGINTRGEGAELCDLLVVFENQVLIFSDKDCAFPDHDDEMVAWSRWYRKAILKSAQQVWGAERWIRDHPDRVFVDRKCTKKLPIPLPSPETAVFHRIVVAHDTSGERARRTGGSGTLLINPALKGAMHMESLENGGHPFAIGFVDESKGFVHVLDEVSLGIVMQTLDTITDFTKYLERKERFLRSGRLGGAFGEEDLMAFYLKDINPATGDHDFIVPDGPDMILLDEGQWENYRHRPEVHRKWQADRESYLWDAVIDDVSQHIIEGSLYEPPSPSIAENERLVRFLAREPRVRRRMLARSLRERIADCPPPGLVSFRTMEPSYPGDPYYVFVIDTPDEDVHPETPNWDRHRQRRREILTAYSQCAMEHYHHAQHVVGIATEGGFGKGRSHDFVLLAREHWNDQLARDAREMKTKLGWFQKLRISRGREEEYPDGPSALGRDFTLSIKKIGRNDPCPCGNGKKYKKCHGA